jgi:CMP-N-acetylneuraminic acid synthetase
MKEELKILAIILARGGSKGLPKKNIKIFCDKPLISWAISQALKSNAFEDVVVSTDCSEISKIAKESGAYVPFLRPKELAQDTSSSIDAIIHSIDYLSEIGKDYDAVCLLEPTSPLRTPDQLKLIVEDYKKKCNQYTSVITVGKIREPLELFKVLDGDALKPLKSSTHSQSRRQDMNDYYFPYGVAYIANTINLREEKTLYTSKCSYYVIEDNQCFEIDDQIDFDINEYLFQKYYYNKQ